MSDSQPPIATLPWAPFVYGETGPGGDDPAEAYHEASKLSPLMADPDLPGRSLATNRPLRASSARAVKRYVGALSRQLPAPELGSATLATALARRRSLRTFSCEPLTVGVVGGLLHAAYGVTQEASEALPPLRTAPSGGALFPLDLYPVAVGVDGVASGVYHYDPLSHRIETLRETEPSESLAALTVYSELLESARLVIFIAAIFWRSRFKYGLRGYRFALLEAGHVAQNVLLAAAALELAAVPVGGFYDRLVDEYLGLDGVNESVVYAVALGREAA